MSIYVITGKWAIISLRDWGKALESNGVRTQEAVYPNMDKIVIDLQGDTASLGPEAPPYCIGSR